MANFENDITNSLKALQSNGIILYPTDTIWGLGCDATDTVAIKKIYELKKREEKKAMIILVSDENMIRNYVLNPNKKLLDFISSQKKPTTAIFENAINLSAQLINEDGTIAVRIVHDDFCSQLILQLKKPLVSTSANISGESYPKHFLDISAEIKKGVDYIVQHRQSDFEINSPSSIIKLIKDKIEIIR
ncbi:MAG: L-threonylcarbamoyladenylate synthase [Bacteroidota bacterium]|nr:L-threonylcarbamoyladenylate synthase [Bacteroidota bacterium]